LQLDACEQIAGKQRRQNLNTLASAVTPLPDFRQVNFKAGLLQKELHHLLASWLQPGAAQIPRRSPDDVKTAGTVTGLARVFLADELARQRLYESPRPLGIALFTT